MALGQLQVFLYSLRLVSRCNFSIDPVCRVESGPGFSNFIRMSIRSGIVINIFSTLPIQLIQGDTDLRRERHHAGFFI